MDSKENKLCLLPVKVNQIAKNSLKVNLEAIFSDRYSSYLSNFDIFLAHFNIVPNYIEEIRINCTKAGEWLHTHYAADIKDVHYGKRYFGNNKQAEVDDLYCVLFEDLTIYFDTNRFYS